MWALVVRLFSPAPEVSFSHTLDWQMNIAPLFEPEVTKELLLVEVEDLLRTVPEGSLLSPTTEVFAWLGRVTAVIEKWNLAKGIPKAVYLLHCFQKKSKKGIETPKPTLDLIKRRLKMAEEHYKAAYSA